MNEDDSQLLEAARAGDTAALERLLERHQAQVYRFGMKMCRDPEDAKDVLQETLLTLARNIRGFRGESSFSTWLYTVARSFCIKKRRRKSHVVDADRAEAERVADSADATDDTIAGKQVQRALDAAIASLDPGQREVLLLRDVEGLTAPEVAEVLGIGVPAVKSRLHRARFAVRERVAPMLELPAPAAAAPAAIEACPDVLSLLSRKLEDEIDAGTCAEMERHVEGCARCRGACDSLRRTLALCRAVPGPEVPADVQESVRRAIRAINVNPLDR